MKVDIKPLSVNQCWAGKLRKKVAYLKYQRDLGMLLRPLTIPEGKIHLKLIIGFSSKGSDIDNVCKPLLDILQKKYGFNDNRIYKLELEKEIVKKGEEYIDFEFKPYGLKSYEQIN